MPWDSIKVLYSVWPNMLLGSALALFGLWVGVVTARSPAQAPVRWISWWVDHVILPLLRFRSWWRRAVTIFANNISILAVLVGAGTWPVAPIIGTAFIGISMGIAMRVMYEHPDALSLHVTGENPFPRGRLRFGIALNLLEPPAIAAALGLALGRRVAPLTSDQTWHAFAIGVLPAMLLAAGGEALWLGEVIRSEAAIRRQEPDPPKSDAE